MNPSISSVLLALAIVSAGCESKPQTPPVPRNGPATETVSSAEGPRSLKLIAPADADRPLTEPSQLPSDEQLRDGWISLFDGQTLFGWTANSETDWSVKNGEIVSTGPAGLLLTTSRFRDYELTCEVWLAAGGNSGLFLRTVLDPVDPAKDCLEFNLCDSHESYPTGSLVARQKSSSEQKIEGGWHKVIVRLEGDRCVAVIDGQPVLDATNEGFSQTGGHQIGLQQNGGEVRFRNVFLKPLGLEMILDVASLGDWRFAPGESDASVKADENAVRLQGTGYLEGQATYGDFVLQFEAKLNAKDVNSGLFFRAEPSTKEAPSNGYELQLQNTIAGGDRTKPADYGEGFGTGAIFRRQKARYVNANDEEWFAVTLVADGNHFASWVNGLQVTDFRDERQPDPNPRNGRRDEAGHLSLQGHDAATDASFREVRIAPLAFE
ncbi:MAG: DUF1080 domain-containing protein [Planctomycetota bacterium]|nr:DUF1080 domain-containing protein [Planctomycetaceae bacterium]MDQ3332437.1 DUF1080 domain-containing protein [Planctomycetota bacterium]